MLRQITHRGSTTTLLTVGLLVAGAVVAGCRGTKAEDANAEAAPPPTAIGTENLTVVTQAELATGPSISGNLQAAEEAMVRAQASLGCALTGDEDHHGREDRDDDQ